ncbi:MAG: AAA family ATPase [Mariprofundus sp.]
MTYLEMPTHIQAFYKADTYPHATNTIEMIQTHASWVFLSGDFAYKFKKPVDFGFMDFSTLAKRKYYCEQELTLNRKLSPDIYLAVLPVYQFGETFNLSGLGKVADYCVKMFQFDQSDLLDKKMEHDELDPQWMDQLAENVARFHAQAAINTDSTFDHASLLAEHLQDNLAIAVRYSQQAIDSTQLQTLLNFKNSQLATHQKPLKQRQSELHIRHCHGDLHFRNITLLHGKPTLFDCIEFNAEYSIIDCMNDIAFLVMDCDAHARPDLGMRFLSRYLEYCGDYAGLTLLPLYLFYRATVRGKVACILAEELANERIGEQQQAQWFEARSYFNLASTYTKQQQPTLFAIGGLSGSGKSHLSLLGCGKERAIIIRSDATRQRISADYPDLELYSRAMHINTYKAMFDAARTVLQAGYSVILDATFLHPDSRQQAYQLACECGAELHFLWLDIETDRLKENICNRQQAGHDISDADLSVLALQLTEYQRPDEIFIRFLSSNEQWPSNL